MAALKGIHAAGVSWHLAGGVMFQRVCVAASVTNSFVDDTENIVICICVIASIAAVGMGFHAFQKVGVGGDRQQATT